MINVNNIPLHPHSSDLSDSPESIDDSLSNKSDINKTNDKAFLYRNKCKDKLSSKSNISEGISHSNKYKKEEEIGNSFISDIPVFCSPEGPELKTDENEDINEILKSLEGSGKEYEKIDFDIDIKINTDFTTSKIKIKEESFKDNKNDKAFLKKKRKNK